MSDRCDCRRCLIHDDPGGCLRLERIHADQVRRGIIPADQYMLALDTEGNPL